MPARTGWLTALVIAAAGVALRLGGALGFSLNADEGIYYYVAHAPAGEARMLITNNAHPPLHYLLLRAMAAFGDSPLWLRLPSLVAGGLSILALYVLGKRVGGQRTGLLAAALLAISPGAIMLSQVARPYALQILLLTISLASLAEYARSSRGRWLAPYALALGAAQLLQYGSYVVLGGVLLLLAGLAASRRLSGRALSQLALAHAPLALVGAAAFFLHIRPRLGGLLHAEALSGWLEAYFVRDFAGAWLALLGLFEYLAGPFFAAAALAFLGGLAACALTGRGRWAALAAAVLLLALVLSAAGLYPLGATRHAAYAAPIVAVTVAYGLDRALSRGALPATAALVALLVAGLAGEPLGRLLGARPDRPPPFRELRVTRGERAEIERELVALGDTRGVLLLDLATVYTLAPLFRTYGWHGGELLRFRWREREVVVLHPWFMDLSRLEQLPRYLALVDAKEPALAALAAGDLRVVSYTETPPRASEGLRPSAPRRRSLYSDEVETAHYELFRLDLPAYRKAMERTVERIRRKARAARDAEARAPGITSPP